MQLSQHLGQQQSISNSACSEPASSIIPESAAWFSSRSQLFFSMFSAPLSFSFRLASSAIGVCSSNIIIFDDE